MIGRLRHYVTLQKFVQTSNEGGAILGNWQTITPNGSIYAAITAIAAEEALQFSQVAKKSTHRMTIRYRTDVQPGMRILKGSEAYRINAIADREGSGKWLDMLTTQIPV